MGASPSQPAPTASASSSASPAIGATPTPAPDPRLTPASTSNTITSSPTRSPHRDRAPSNATTTTTSISSESFPSTRDGQPWWRDRIAALHLTPVLLLESAPPSFEFSLDDHADDARAMIGTIPDVGVIRYKLVPAKITEITFWRNLFWHLSQPIIPSPSNNVVDRLLTPSKPIPSHDDSSSPHLTSHHSSSNHDIHHHHHSSSSPDPSDVGSRLELMSLRAENRWLRNELERYEKEMKEYQEKIRILESRTPPQPCTRCHTLIDPTSTPPPCSYHTGTWTLDHHAQEFFAFDSTLRENLRSEKRKRLAEVQKQMAFIYDSDDPTKATGEWNCCHEKCYDSKGCKQDTQHQLSTT